MTKNNETIKLTFPVDQWIDENQKTYKYVPATMHYRCNETGLLHTCLCSSSTPGKPGSAYALVSKDGVKAAW